VDTIVDKFGITRTVTRTSLGGNAVACFAFAGNFPGAGTFLRIEAGCISDVPMRGRDNRGSCRSSTDSEPRTPSSAGHSVRAP
jgi:hypothetical protein